MSGQDKAVLLSGSRAKAEHPSGGGMAVVTRATSMA